MKIFGIVKTWVVAHKVAAIAIGAGGAAVIATSVAVPVAVANHKASQQKKDEEAPETPTGPVDPLTPEQRDNATATYEIMFNLVKDDFGEVIANASKDYILEKAEYVTLKNGRAEKISTYVADGRGVSLSDPSSVFKYGKAIYDDGGVSDAVYFATALSKCYLKASSIAFYKQADYFTFALSTLDEEGDNLANNAITIINKVYSVSDGVEAIANSTEVGGLLLSIVTQKTFNPNDVKGVFSQVDGLVKSLDEVRDNVKYFGNFSKKVLGSLPEIFPKIPEKIKEIINALEFSVAIDAVFDVVNAFGDKFVSLPDSYYEHLEEITLPYESYAYTVVGLLASFVPELEIDTEALDKIPELVVSALNYVYNEISEYIPEEYVEDVEGFLKDENLNSFLNASIKLFKDVISVDYSFITLEKVTHVAAIAAKSIQSGNYESTVDIAEFINEFLEMFTSKEGSDLFVDDIVGVVYPLAQLFATYVYPNLSDEIKDQIGEKYVAVMLVVGFLQYDFISDSVKTIVNDAFIAVRDIFSSFLPEGDIPASADFGELFKLLVQGSPKEAFSVLLDHVPEAKLESVRTLATDVYSLVDSLGFSSTLLDVLDEKFGEEFAKHEIDITAVADGTEFANAIYTVVASYLAAA